MSDPGNAMILFILGPTSSGKSRVAVRLAEKLAGEVISCDSMQVYKDMDIITQAPEKDILSRVPHHLIGTVPPEEEFSAARFIDTAKGIINTLIFAGKVPIIAGGTGLYVKALVDGIFEAPAKDKDLREALQSIASKKGNDHIYRELEEVDPETAAKLHPNDLRRVIRALEIYKLTGKTASELKMRTEGISREYDCRMFGLKMERKLMYARIEDTVEKMFEEGIVDEVKRVRQGLSLTAGKALGIKEISALLDGETDLKKTKEELKKNTRRYAKRQMTWFRGDKRIVWITADRSTEEIVGEIVSLVN